MRDERCPRAVVLIGAQSTRYDYSNRLGCSVPSTILGIVNTSKRASPALQASRFLILPNFIVWPVPAAPGPRALRLPGKFLDPKAKKVFWVSFPQLLGGTTRGSSPGCPGGAVLWPRHPQPWQQADRPPRRGTRTSPIPKPKVVNSAADRPPRRGTRTSPRPKSTSSTLQPPGIMLASATPGWEFRGQRSAKP